MSTAQTLSVEERILIARQALVIMEHNYAHLRLKTAGAEQASDGIFDSAVAIRPSK